MAHWLNYNADEQQKWDLNRELDSNPHSWSVASHAASVSDHMV